MNGSFFWVIMFSYLQFLLKSTNQHGVHSPFVFNYITKGIYQRNLTLNKNKSLTWLCRSLSYFNGTTYLFNSIDINITNQTFYINDAKVIALSFDLKIEKDVNQLIENLDENQILLITLENYPKMFLNKLRSNPDITLVVDFYVGCLISKRKEQPKQNFYIRF